MRISFEHGAYTIRPRFKITKESGSPYSFIDVKGNPTKTKKVPQ